MDMRASTKLSANPKDVNTNLDVEPHLYHRYQRHHQQRRPVNRRLNFTDTGIRIRFLALIALFLVPSSNATTTPIQTQTRTAELYSDIGVTGGAMAPLPICASTVDVAEYREKTAHLPFSVSCAPTFVFAHLLRGFWAQSTVREMLLSSSERDEYSMDKEEWATRDSDDKSGGIEVLLKKLDVIERTKSCEVFGDTTSEAKHLVAAHEGVSLKQKGPRENKWRERAIGINVCTGGSNKRIVVLLEYRASLFIVYIWVDVVAVVCVGCLFIEWFSAQSTASGILSRSSEMSAHSMVKELEVTKDGAHKSVQIEALLIELEAAKQEPQVEQLIEVCDKKVDQLRSETLRLRRKLEQHSRRDRVDESGKISLVEKPQGQESIRESSAVLGIAELESLETETMEVMSRMEADIRKKDEESDGLEGVAARAQEDIGVLKVRLESEQLGRVHVEHTANTDSELELSRINEAHSELKIALVRKSAESAKKFFSQSTMRCSRDCRRLFVQGAF